MELHTLAKALASDQMKVRKRAQYDVENILRRETKSDAALPTYSEMLAICKGLHYTLWMQDKLLLKEEVVRRICHILPLIPHETTRIHYVNAMFETLAREWDRLDNWRVDKFMLLTRDFFVQALHSLVSVDREVWNHVLGAIFEKILNTDIQHAIGLKMHMCTVLAEELSKKKIKSLCVVLTLVHLVSRLVALPRHHTYSHNLLRVIHTLLGTLRRHSKANTQPLTEKLLELVSERGPHFKSVRRISLIVHSIVEQLKKKRKEKEVPTLGVAPDLVSQPEPESGIPLLIPSECPTTASSQKPTKKRKKILQKDKLSQKKRRLTENSSESIVDISLTADRVNCSPVEQSKKEATLVTVGDSSSITTPDATQALSVSQDAAPSIHANDTSLFDGIVPDTLIPTTSHKTPVSVSTPIDCLEKPKRRVSFGKVFRKRFIASQRLSMTPTMKITPKKGILRDQTQAGTRSRLSL